MSELKVGDKAPDFSVVNDANETVNLKDLAGQKVILYFYPQDNPRAVPLRHNNLMKRIKSYKMPDTLYWVSVVIP